MSSVDFQHLFEHNIEELKSILRDDPTLMNANNIQGQTPLIKASLDGHCKLVEFLFEHSRDRNYLFLMNEPESSRKRRNSLMVACEGGHHHVARVLVDNEIDLRYENYKGRTALIVSAAAGEKECVKIILQKYDNVDAKDASGLTALHACYYGLISSKLKDNKIPDYIACIVELIVHGASIFIKNNYEYFSFAEVFHKLDSSLQINIFMALLKRDLIVCSDLLPYCESPLTTMNTILHPSNNYFRQEIKAQYFDKLEKQQDVTEACVKWILAIGESTKRHPNEKNALEEDIKDIFISTIQAIFECFRLYPEKTLQILLPNISFQQIGCDKSLLNLLQIYAIHSEDDDSNEDMAKKVIPFCFKHDIKAVLNQPPIITVTYKVLDSFCDYYIADYLINVDKIDKKKDSWGVLKAVSLWKRYVTDNYRHNDEIIKSMYASSNPQINIIGEFISKLIFTFSVISVSYEHTFHPDIQHSSVTCRELILIICIAGDALFELGQIIEANFTWEGYIGSDYWNGFDLVAVLMCILWFETELFGPYNYFGAVLWLIVATLKLLQLSMRVNAPSKKTNVSMIFKAGKAWDIFCIILLVVYYKVWLVIDEHILINLCTLPQESYNNIGRTSLTLSIVPLALGLLRYYAMLHSDIGEAVIIIWEMISKLWVLIRVYLVFLVSMAIVFNHLFSSTEAHSSFSSALLTLYKYTQDGADVSYFSSITTPISFYHKGLGISLLIGFSVIGSFVFMNLANAQMNQSYDTIKQEAKVEWSYSRAKFVSRYIRTKPPHLFCMLPAPLNLLPIIIEWTIGWFRKDCAILFSKFMYAFIGGFWMRLKDQQRDCLAVLNDGRDCFPWLRHSLYEFKWLYVYAICILDCSFAIPFSLYHQLPPAEKTLNDIVKELKTQEGTTQVGDIKPIFNQNDIDMILEKVVLNRSK